MASLSYGISYLLPTRWFEYGRWSTLPENWFRKNPFITRRQAVSHLIAGLTLAAVGWPALFLLAGNPAVNVVLVLPFIAAAAALIRVLTRRTRLALIVGFLVFVVSAPTIAAAGSAPALDRAGRDTSVGALLFEGRARAVAHLRSTDGERPIVILGQTVLGDLVVRIGNSLFAVNARFGTPPSPGTEYWITKLAR